MFLVEATYWALKTHDANTGNGCIIVKDRTILSHGYNGFIRGIDDCLLPNTRPEKYDFMIHAEQNAICNLARNGISCSGAIAYITDYPCLHCLQSMYQAGISKVIHTNISQSNCIIKEKEKFNLLVALMKPQMEVIFIPKELIDFSHLEKLVRKFKNEETKT
uniref:Putative CMP/dCMP deaminase zinc-binding n=1 Tax=viral metagenome TaxID=1070528 RepID=A0A6M3IKZ2_9ZZZZ